MRRGVLPAAGAQPVGAAEAARVAIVLVLVIAGPPLAGCGEPQEVVVAREVDRMVLGLRDRAENPEALDEAATEVAAKGTLALDHLAVLLRSRDAKVRCVSAALLGRAKYGPSVQPLAATLKDQKHEVRAEAAEALGRIGDARAAQPLGAALRDSMPDVRVRAAKALRQVGGVGALRPLLIAATEPYPTGVWKAVIETLEQIRKTHGLEPLLASLKDDDPVVREGAALVLGGARDRQATGPLLAALKDENARVRAQAARSLGRTAEARAVEPLIDALKDESPEARRGAADGLGVLKDPRAIGPLMATITDGDRLVERQVMQALVNLGELSVEPLIAVLNHEDPLVRLKAVWALGQIKDYRAIEPLIRTISTDKNSHVIRWAGDSLVKITGYQREPVPAYWQAWWAQNKEKFGGPGRD